MNFKFKNLSFICSIKNIDSINKNIYDTFQINNIKELNLDFFQNISLFNFTENINDSLLLNNEFNDSSKIKLRNLGKFFFKIIKKIIIREIHKKLVKSTPIALTVACKSPKIINVLGMMINVKMIL